MLESETSFFEVLAACPGDTVNIKVAARLPFKIVDVKILRLNRGERAVVQRRSFTIIIIFLRLSFLRLNVSGGLDLHPVGANLFYILNTQQSEDFSAGYILIQKLPIVISTFDRMIAISKYSQTCRFWMPLDQDVSFTDR